MPSWHHFLLFTKTISDSKHFIFSQQHVQDGRKESLDGYVTTFSKGLPPDGNGGVFALDCEMVSQTGFILLKTHELATLCVFDFGFDLMKATLI